MKDKRTTSVNTNKYGTGSFQYRKAKAENTGGKG